jgi:tRNA threonylcarbamoyladenosine biosynthesis protein TsaE
MPSLLFELNFSLNDIRIAASRFWERAKNYRVMTFSGQLGAGKTTFIHELCEYLGVVDTVSSPTFALINEYHFSDGHKDRVIYHMDWYRLRDEEEAINAGMEDRLSDIEAYCFIEWPEKAPGLLSFPYIFVNIESVNETERKMQVLLMTKP